MDQQIFREQYDIFIERIRRKGKVPFMSFQEGLPQEWEGYKEPLRQRALAILDAKSWQKGKIGKGQILKRLIAAIEISKTDDGDSANNLVTWHAGYGHQSRSHYRLLDALDEPDLRQRVEQWAFEFYRENEDPSDAFERLREITGARYDLVAYLMFLKDSEHFMPIKVQTFDAAFSALGIDVRTSGSCSWENYKQYNKALADIREELAKIAGLSNVRLLDAHSFCWLLVRPEMEPSDDLFINSDKGKASNAKKLDAIDNSIFDMAFGAANTAASSNGQQVLVTKKNKNIFFSQEEMREFIRAKLKSQNNECALTGIRLQFKGEHTDPCRLASLDRIDSNKHYEPENLQVVCRFINQWKSDTPDDEFRRLLQLVRNPKEGI